MFAIGLKQIKSQACVGIFQFQCVNIYIEIFITIILGTFRGLLAGIIYACMCYILLHYTLKSGV